MPTIITHTAIPLALGIAAGRTAVSRRLLLAGTVSSMLPDLDVVAFRLGIPYAAALGHRGFSHSLLLALGLAAIGALAFRALRSTPLSAFLFIFASAASHALLDAFTNGGLGVALFWPWSSARVFAPVRVIEVSPIGVSQFFSHRGWLVLQSEALWVWGPALLGGLCLAALRHSRVLFQQSRPNVRRP